MKVPIVVGITPLLRSALVIVATTFLFALCSTSHAVVSREDYDVDGDGLIELYSAEDLAAISSPFGPSSISLYDQTNGCPPTGCIGYELENNIDLTDIWVSPHLMIDVVFEGNGYTISNFKPRDRGIGLFERLIDCTVKNLVLKDFELSANIEFAGGLAAMASNTLVLNSSMSGTLSNSHYTGGFFGVADAVAIVNSRFNGSIDVRGYSLGAGGLIGFGNRVFIYASSAQGGVHDRSPSDPIGGLIGVGHGEAVITASYANMFNVNDNVSGGLVGESADRIIIRNSYASSPSEEAEHGYATVLHFFDGSSATEESFTGYSDISLGQLACPTGEVDEGCQPHTLFSGWSVHKDEAGEGVWVYGSSEDNPSISDSLVFSDVDMDEDGVIDFLDHFPTQPEIFLDHDNDGKPDILGLRCFADCEDASSIVLDEQISFDTESTLNDPSQAGGAVSYFELLCGFLVFALSRLRAARRLLK